jgi:hypothetical protein
MPPATRTPNQPGAASNEVPCGTWDRMALSNLSAMLGPIASLHAVGGGGDLVRLVITHESGATSTASLSLSAPPDGTSFETGLWGESGTTLLPRTTTPAAESFTQAATELVAAAESGDSHPVDVASAPESSNY